MSQLNPSRRRFLTNTASLACAGLAGRVGVAQDNLKPQVEGNLAWYNVEDWGVEGKGFDDTARYFDRLPQRAEQRVRAAVWGLSRHSAGMLVRFKTNATSIDVRYRLLSNRLDLPHMPATGVSGLDLYARDTQGQDRWLGVTKPTQQEMRVQINSGIDPLPEGQSRLFTIYLPLYNGVEQLAVGVPPGASFSPVAPRTEKPFVFYGTSIMQGACASRPGMSITGIVGRRLNVPTINLGFSGNGRMEKEVGEFLVELDPRAYIIDCLPNMRASEVAARAEPLVHQLRKARPQTPILLVEDRTNAGAVFRSSQRSRHAQSREALRKAYERLVDASVKHLHYLPGDRLLGGDGESTTDGSHPNDLGMMRYADAYCAALQDMV